MYEHLKCFCTFIGYTRSGHSIVGALMDAHPDVVIAHEQDVFGRTEGGGVTGRPLFETREEMFDAILRKSRRQARAGRGGYRMRADGSEYRVSYAVPDQWQGRVRELQVIGNKRGQVTAKSLRENRDALRLLEELAGVPVKLIHVVRNPFDNIATMTPIHADRSTLRYFGRAQQVALAKEDGWPVLDVFLEDFIEDPRRELTRICHHVGVAPDPDYLDACAAIVLKKPHESRHQREWTAREIKTVRKRMDLYPWLARYRESEVAAVGPAKSLQQASKSGRARVAEQVRSLLGRNP